MRFIARQGRALLLTAAVVAIGLSGCGGGGGGGGGKPSDLIGHWVYSGGSERGPTGTMELFKDGTGVNDGKTITWKVENKRFIIQSSDVGIACDYKVSSTILSLTYDDNTSAIFINKNNFKMEHSTSSFTDSRDGKKYKTVKISGQVWMAENMNYETSDGSWCYENNNSKCDIYGRLYDWNTALSICPPGWHLSSRDEWNELVGMVNVANGAAGDSKKAGKKLASASGWYSNANGSDDYGFSALPGGARYSDGRFGYRILFGKAGNYWTATESRNSAYNWIITEESMSENDEGHKNSGFSVRCVKDE